MWNSLAGESISLNDEKLLDWLGIEPDTPRNAIGEVTYFTCLKMLSETMGKMPLKFYKQTDKGKIRAEPNREHQDSLMEQTESAHDPDNILGNNRIQLRTLWKCICLDSDKV